MKHAHDVPDMLWKIQIAQFAFRCFSVIGNKKLQEALQGLRGVSSIADDVIVHGRTEDEHDRHLRGFLQRCRQKRIKLNCTKFELKMTSITFMGHKITPEGRQTDPEKITAILKMLSPSNVD